MAKALRILNGTCALVEAPGQSAPEPKPFPIYLFAITASLPPALLFFSGLALIWVIRGFRGTEA